MTPTTMSHVISMYFVAVLVLIMETMDLTKYAIRADPWKFWASVVLNVMAVSLFVYATLMWRAIRRRADVQEDPHSRHEP